MPSSSLYRRASWSLTHLHSVIRLRTATATYTDDAAGQCTISCKHSLVLLRMGEIIAPNMLSWLKLLINRYCCILLVVYVIVSMMHGHTNIKFTCSQFTVDICLVATGTTDGWSTRLWTTFLPQCFSARTTRGKQDGLVIRVHDLNDPNISSCLWYGVQTL